ncbi:PREDICTED: inactive tyrosine-protein kinase 7-like [Priapulus caudatus]|uniref:Inactive tyrosine-protein kinase 7-like n=1 Tax=Priapulus caudatus TaxID=37621 RepID=A0ABM1E6U2_PRICU|nr:PREDICTED: inactive tyrosine-protein kinase 7-like [Priapulus caudatus]
MEASVPIHRYTHRDLAARNCLITSGYEVKVANMSLTRDIYAKEYDRWRGTAAAPVRWMPPEALADDDFSTRADVWSFGVLAWEVFTQGDLPYSGRAGDDIAAGVAAGSLRLPPLDQCPEPLHAVMRACWSPRSADRPSFSELAVSIGEMTVDSDL